MAQLNSQVSALLEIGADAMDNMFDVHIHLPQAVLDATRYYIDGKTQEHTMSLRCLGFTPPKFTLKTYDSSYKTMRVKRPAGKIEGERFFQLQFRLDAYYSVYRTFLAWRSAHLQPSTGFASNDLESHMSHYDDFLGWIQVSAADTPVSQQPGQGYNADGVTRGGFLGSQEVTYGVRSTLNWTFNRVWIIDMDNPKFITGSGEIQLITVIFGFTDYEDSQLYDRNWLRPGSPQRIIPEPNLS
jgi:hypothetical protein